MKIFNQLKKFKSIKKGVDLYLSDGFFSNRHWLFCANWLDGVKKSRMTMGLLKKLNAKRVEIVTARVNGDDLKSVGLTKIIQSLDLSKYSKIVLNAETISVKTGFRRNGDPIESIVAVIIKREGFEPIGVDPEYFSAFLHFDPAIEILVRSWDAPILATKNNKIVAAIMPMRLEK